MMDQGCICDDDHNVALIICFPCCYLLNIPFENSPGWRSIDAQSCKGDLSAFFFLTSNTIKTTVSLAPAFVFPPKYYESTANLIGTFI